jgi:SAM-dependent methyltransferase
MDEAPDRAFYAMTRLVTHIDDGAIAALTALYRDVLPAGGAVLDLMSSWVSHLPPEVAYGRVVGHGMSAEELAANRRLDERLVRDLNETPSLPFEDATFDAACCCVSVQYLTRPVEVFAEIGRVLRPGAPFVVSFSNRCFPTKAVFLWQALEHGQHADLVAHYMLRSGRFERLEKIDAVPEGSGRDPLCAVVGRARPQS